MRTKFWPVRFQGKSSRVSPRRRWDCIQKFVIEIVCEVGLNYFWKGSSSGLFWTR